MLYCGKILDTSIKVMPRILDRGAKIPAELECQTHFKIIQICTNCTTLQNNAWQGIAEV